MLPSDIPKKFNKFTINQEKMKLFPGQCRYTETWLNKIPGVNFFYSFLVKKEMESQLGFNQIILQ